MKYVLVENGTNDIVTTVELAGGIGVSGAKTYFMKTKRMKEKNFNTLWTVYTEVGYKSKTAREKPGYIEWWKDESLKLDIEKE
jgi:hypothetical protein|tara:strand:- start:50 stop:298 length:249 start_codon:yes stop_codon:yes gene_type:complete